MKTRQKNRVLYGTISTSENKIENVRCEVHLSEGDTSRLSAEVYDVAGSIAPAFMMNFMGKEVDFTSSIDNEEIKFSGLVSSMQLGGGSDWIARINIQNYEETTIFEKCSVTGVSFLFHLSPIEMFERRRVQSYDDSKGLLYGWDAWTEPGKPKWISESYDFDTDLGKLTFYPGLVFSEDEDGVVVKERTKARYLAETVGLDLSALRRSVEAVLKSYLHMISFLEGRFTNWHYATISGCAGNGKDFLTSIYRRLPRFEYRPTQHVNRHTASYRNILPKIVGSYTLVEQQKRTEIDKAIKQLLIANKPEQPVDTELLYWHSCLDILIKLLSERRFEERKKQGFSKRLVLACEDANIDWGDLYPYIRRDDIFSDDVKANFKITTFRNNIIHAGDYPELEEFSEVIEENARAAALAERMLMRAVGVQYEGTPVGQYRHLR